ncbi:MULTISPECIES: hypothetical protein [unclassified Mesorhizobium]|uniref:hypothetical protein n=1 Tax=unclassified Mesorhizobium TaxID=325217 RepID=UPI00333980AC
MVSDAWLCVSEALNRELNLGEWFSSFPDIVDSADEIVAELLAVQTSACVPSMPDEDLTFEELEVARHLGSPEVADTEEYNFMRHPQDEALAPSVLLFSLAMVKAAGRLGAERDAAKNGKRANIHFWREVVLQLLPRRGGGIVPCVTLVPKISLCDPTGRPIELRTPFSRPIGDLRRVPLLLTRSSGLTWFYPESLNDFEDSLSGAGWSVDSVYQTAWMASPGVVAILLRMIADGVDRPINRAVDACADRNTDFPSQFALGTIGNVIERATFAASRGDGIGALLREDFHRRDRVLRKHGVVADGSPFPSRFYRAWK